MDGAADRVDLRGLRLLEQARSRRRDEARDALGRAQAAARAAAAAVLDAERALDTHEASWRSFETGSLDAMRSGAVDGLRFRERRATLDRMADQAVRLRQRIREAQAQASTAQEASCAAASVVAQLQKRLDQTVTIAGRVVASRELAATQSADQELDDEIGQRFGRRAMRT